MAKGDRAHAGMQRMAGLFELYSLSSLNLEPKSGYDIIKEIEEKSNGNIVASKGTIYPLLDSLEERGMVRVVDTFARGRKVLSLTLKGKKHLSELDMQERSIRNKMKYLPFLFAEFKNAHSDTDTLLFRLFVLSDGCRKEDEAKIKAILKDCLKDIEKVTKCRR